MDLKIMGIIMIVPTIAVAIYITLKSKDRPSDLWPNLAVVCWISANSVWMIGEFYFNDTTRPIALVFFVIGFIAIGYHYLVSEPFWKKNIPGI